MWLAADTSPEAHRRQPVLARREDQIIIGGHQRLVAAGRLGLMSVPVIRLDLPTKRRCDGDGGDSIASFSTGTSSSVA